MRSLLAFLLGNWPLKLGAVALATVLYGGVVLSQNTRTWPGQVPIEIRNPPRDATVLEFLGNVSNIQFRAPLDVASRLANGSFGASIDLANVVVPTDGSQVAVPVTLTAIDRSVEIVDYQPKVVRVTLDPIVRQAIPVTVEQGQVPEAVRVGPPQVDPQLVTLIGARSRVSTVREVAARVIIDASGLNVDQEVDLQAIDSNGTPVAGVQIQPARARVRIDVARDQATVQLPVRVQLTGVPTHGYELTAVTVTPVNVTVSGEAPVVGRLGGVSTLPVDLEGRSASFATDVALDLPKDVTVDGSTMVHVTVTLAVAQVSRTIEAGVELRGGNPDLLYELTRPSVLVTLSGPATVLDAVAPADLHAILLVGSLAPGSHQVTVSLTPPDGTDVLLIAPAQVEVIVTEAPHITPEPSPTPAPSPIPSPSPTP